MRIFPVGRQLAGADAPEIHKNEAFAQVSRAYLEERLQGKRVWLDFLDAGDPLDYKHRLLCWAWVMIDFILYLHFQQLWMKRLSTP